MDVRDTTASPLGETRGMSDGKVSPRRRTASPLYRDARQGDGLAEGAAAARRDAGELLASLVKLESPVSCYEAFEERRARSGELS